MSADKDRGIRRQKQKRAKEQKRQLRDQRSQSAGTPAAAPAKAKSACASAARPKRHTPPVFRSEGRVALATIWHSGGMRSGVP